MLETIAGILLRFVDELDASDKMLAARLNHARVEGADHVPLRPRFVTTVTR